MSLPPGEVFAGFTIERELGAGGMGVVYLARHPRLPRRVALKLLRTDLGADPSFVGRFRREAETVARLDHPNIVAIDDSGAENGQLWISMRFIDGTTAGGALSDYPAGMPPLRAVNIIEKVAAALDFAHRHHIVHRDVKPANILLAGDSDGDEERVFLTDFGVAKAMGEIEAQATSLTTAGGVVATLDYAAPEQVEGRTLDGRCDEFALGCVLYKLLTGEIPYPGETLAAKVYARMHRPPPMPTAVAPGLPARFDEVIAKALATDPDDRYQTCRALAVAARAAIGPQDPLLTVAADPDATRVVDPDVTKLMGDRARTGPSSAAVPDGSVSAGRDATGPGYTSVENLPPDLARLLGPGVAQNPIGPRRTGRSPNANRRRAVLAVGAVLLVAVVVVGVALLSRGGIAGNASAGLQSTVGSPPATSRATTQSSAITTRNSSAATSAGGLPAVAALPHSSPLPAGTILTSRQYGKTFALYPVAAGSGQIGRAITTPTVNGQNPLISPDRGSIIYLQSDLTGNTVRTVAADGKGDRLLFARPTDCLQIARPAWNPVDTGQLAISCSTKAGPRSIALVDLEGKVSKTLPGTPGVFPSDDLAFSPDGTLLCFWGGSSVTAGDGRLYTQATDGSEPAQPVTPAGSHDADPDFSPDGSNIAFRRVIGTGTQIVTIGQDGSDPQVLTTTASHSQGPVYSPDGTQIAYKNDLRNGSDPPKNELWVLTVASPQDAHQLLEGDAGSIVASPAWGNR